MSRPLPVSRAHQAATIALLVGLLGAAAPSGGLAQTANPAAPATSPAADGVRLEPLSGSYVAVARSNLRQQPSQQGTRLGQIDAGAKVVVTGKVVDSPWYAVTREDGRRGYVFADLLRPETPPAAPTAPPADPVPPAPVVPPVAATPTPVAPEPAAVTPPQPSPVQSAPAQPDPVVTALTERLNSMDAALADIRKSLDSGTAVKGLEERQKTLESAITALRNDVTGLRSAASDGDKPGGFLDRLMSLQDQISAQIAEQRADLTGLAKRLDEAEAWLKPVKEWAEKTANDVRPPMGWTEWLMSGPWAAWSWLTTGWWWQTPTQPETPVTPLRLPDPPSPGGRSTIMG